MFSNIGLDIPQVSLVINYDPPVTYEEHPQPDYDTYLHRIGRYSFSLFPLFFDKI
jgi:superfamily II DNA/RNA helicase